MKHLNKFNESYRQGNPKMTPEGEKETLNKKMLSEDWKEIEDIFQHYADNNNLTKIPYSEFNGKYIPDGYYIMYITSSLWPNKSSIRYKNNPGIKRVERHELKIHTSLGHESEKFTEDMQDFKIKLNKLGFDVSVLGDSNMCSLIITFRT